MLKGGLLADKATMAHYGTNHRKQLWNLSACVQAEKRKKYHFVLHLEIIWNLS